MNSSEDRETLDRDKSETKILKSKGTRTLGYTIKNGTKRGEKRK